MGCFLCKEIRDVDNTPDNPSSLYTYNDHHNESLSIKSVSEDRETPLIIPASVKQVNVQTGQMPTVNRVRTSSRNPCVTTICVQPATDKNNEVSKNHELRSNKQNRSHNSYSSARITTSKSGHKIVISDFLPNEWTPMGPEETLKFVQINSSTQEFRDVRYLFKNTTRNKYLDVVKLERVQNPYLWGCYQLKKEEMKNRYKQHGVVIRELKLFHGTKERYVESICSNNFDWRRTGAETGIKFGQGVCFSPIAYYSTHYTDKHIFSPNTMLLCKVLGSLETLGYTGMILPPVDMETGLHYDTSVNGKGDVIVKYTDCEFYPEYVIRYCSEDVIARGDYEC